MATVMCVAGVCHHISWNTEVWDIRVVRPIVWQKGVVPSSYGCGWRTGSVPLGNGCGLHINDRWLGNVLRWRLEETKQCHYPWEVMSATTKLLFAVEVCLMWACSFGFTISGSFGSDWNRNTKVQVSVYIVIQVFSSVCWVSICTYKHLSTTRIWSVSLWRASLGLMRQGCVAIVITRRKNFLSSTGSGVVSAHDDGCVAYTYQPLPQTAEGSNAWQTQFIIIVTGNENGANRL